MEYGEKERKREKRKVFKMRRLKSMVCPKTVSHYLIGWFTPSVGSERQDTYISTEKQERARPELLSGRERFVKVGFSFVFFLFLHYDQQKLIAHRIPLRETSRFNPN